MRLWARHGAAIFLGALLLGTSLTVWACGGQSAEDAETGASPSTTALETTTQPSVETAREYVSVLHPYHNIFLDAPTHLIPESVTDTHPLPEFPESIPAQRIVSEILPNTDLRLLPKSVATGHYLWFVPGGDLSSDDGPLSSREVAIEVARAFLSEHGLWDEDYSDPRVSVGSSESGPAGTSVTSWLVRFEREAAAVGLECYVSVRVAGNDEVIGLSLAIPRLEQIEGALVRLRPIAEVIADKDAWQMGDSSALQNRVQGQVSVGIRSVYLAYQDPGSGDEPIAVPVYRFEVEVPNPEGGAPMTGFWSVVAAADVVKDPQQLGAITAPAPR